MNPCFEFLDRAVIEGRADEPVLSAPELSHARLLEDAAAVAGVLRAVGVKPGATVSVRTADDLHAVVAALATLRLGAVPIPDEAQVDEAVFDEAVSEEVQVLVEDRDEVSHVVWAQDTALDWPAVLKAGRTDPASAYETPDGDPAARPDLRQLAVPLTVGELRSLLLHV